MMAEEKKQRRIDRIDGRTVLFLTLCACIVTFFATSFLGHGIFTFWIFLILCWFGLYKQALGCFAVYLVAIVWLMIETKYQISIPSPLLLSMIYKLLLPAMPAYLLAKIPSGKLTASLRKMPIPTRIMLVLIVMLRFAPTVLHEFGEVREGKTIIIAEHRLYYLMDLADRFLCVQKGKIVREFTAQQMKALSNEEIRALGLRTPDLHQIEQAEIPSAATSEVVLEVKKLNHSFGETIVAKDVDFQCRKGEVVALIGPNGTGKSTIGRILAGLLKEKSGEVVLFGKHCRSKGRLGKVWYIPQDLDSQLFGEDLLDELTTGAEVSPERKKAAEEILEALELMPFVKQHPSTLSGGQKQRLALGVALMHEAPIIVLDEPTSGLDGTNMRNVSRMIRKLAKMGRTIIVITHDAECALACCERAIRLENGCITDDFQIRGAELLLDKIGYDKKEG